MLFVGLHLPPYVSLIPSLCPLKIFLLFAICFLLSYFRSLIVICHFLPKQQHEGVLITTPPQRETPTRTTAGHIKDTRFGSIRTSSIPASLAPLFFVPVFFFFEALVGFTSPSENTSSGSSKLDKNSIWLV